MIAVLFVYIDIYIEILDKQTNANLNVHRTYISKCCGHYYCFLNNDDLNDT